MRRLYLDYRRQAPALHPGDGTWLASAVAVLVVVLAYAGWLRAEVGRLEREAARAASQAPVRATQQVALRTREAEVTAAHLARGWEELFDALEASTQARPIALLAIQPDSETHELRLRGEARSLEAALDYVVALEASGALAHVYLAQHQVSSEPERPVRFSLIAAWRSAS